MLGLIWFDWWPWYWDIVGVLATMLVSWFVIALGTPPRQTVKKKAYDAYGYPKEQWIQTENGPRRETVTFEAKELGDRGGFTIIATIVTCISWPLLWALTIGILAVTGVVAGLVYGARGIFKMTDDAKEAPARRRELRKKAEKENNEWWTEQLDNLDKQYKELMEND